ncbi:MAG: HAD family hydrolase [Spirochaetaceae bacterium]|nr:HAD family hydrolase [Spirochaetaceae bacterium]
MKPQNLQSRAPECIKNAGAFIFDFDGTLYDPKHFVRRLLFGGPPGGRFSVPEIRLIGAERKTRKEFSGCDYGGAEPYYERFFAALERQVRGFPLMTPALHEAGGLRQWYFNRYMPRMTAVLGHYYSPRPGAAEFFQFLADGNIPRAVYSDYPQVRERLEAIGLDPGLCGLLFGPESFGAQKPAAAPFLSIAASLGREPGRTLVVGDKDSADGAGARAAGMMYLRITPGSFGELSGFFNTAPSGPWSAAAGMSR